MSNSSKKKSGRKARKPSKAAVTQAASTLGHAKNGARVGKARRSESARLLALAGHHGMAEARRIMAKEGRVAPPAELPVAELSAPAELFELPAANDAFVAERPSDDVDDAPAFVLAIKAAALAVVVVGMYAVLYSILQTIYPGVGGALRAFIPLVVEMVAGGAVHLRGKLTATKLVAAFVGVVLIGGCAYTEILAAAIAPAAMQQARITAIQNEPAFRCAPYAQPAGYAGPVKTRELLAAYEAKCKRDTKAAADNKAARLAAAKATVGGESTLVIALAILGAIGASCFLPALERFVRACGKRS